MVSMLPCVLATNTTQTSHKYAISVNHLLHFLSWKGIRIMKCTQFEAFHGLRHGTTSGLVVISQTLPATKKEIWLVRRLCKLSGIENEQMSREIEFTTPVKARNIVTYLQTVPRRALHRFGNRDSRKHF